MLVKDVIKHVKSDIKKLNPVEEIEIRIYEYSSDKPAIFKFESEIKEVSNFNLQIPEIFLNRKAMYFSTTFYPPISSLSVSISVKEVSIND